MNKLLFILLLLPTSMWSQIAAWRSVHLDPPLDIQQLATDSLGFMWLNDAHVLYRFDGAEIVEKLNLKEEEITSLVYQSDHFLIGTSFGRILTYNPYKANYKVLHDAGNYKAVTDILYIDDDNFVIASYGSGIRLMNKGQLTYINTHNGLVSNEVYDIVLYNEAYYLATDQGIQILDPNESDQLKNKITMIDGLADMVVSHLVVHENNLWYTDYDQHIGMIDKTHKITNYTMGIRSKINGLQFYEQDIYIAVDNGLIRFREGHFSKEYPITGIDKVTVVEKDEEGNIWIAASNQKLLKACLYFQKMQTDFSDIRAFSKLDETLIIGNQYGLYTSKSTGTTKINEDNITHIITVDEYLLVGTFSQGVKVYNKHLQLIDHVKEWVGIKDQSILHIYHHGENVYISSLSGVMQFAFRNGKLSPQHSINHVIGPGYIYTILGMGTKLFFGTDRKGLVEWDPTKNKVINYETFESGEKIGSVYAFTLDKNNNLWFTSDKQGLGYIDHGTIYKRSNHKNAADDYTSLTTLNNGNLLAVRGASIDLVDPLSNHIMYFDKELGLENEVSFLNTVLRDDHQTYFAHDNKIYSYIPESKVKIHPEVIIDNVLVNLLATDGTHKFDQDENNIEFNYRGSWLTDPSKLTYQYKLEGFDEEWRSTKDNSIVFGRLTPGQYNFRVRASENGMFENEPEDTYNFEIRKHFYNYWWFRGIGLILLSVLGWQVIKTRESLKKEKLALEKINIENQFINLKNQLNPHFLFNGFNTLIGLIEEDSNRSIAFVERMSEFYRNMLENGKKNLITLSQEKEMLSQYIDILKTRFNGQLDIIVNIEDQIENYELPPMTLQLLLENAVKHNVVSTKNPLSITIKQSSEYITVKNRKIALVSKSTGTKTGLQNIERRFVLTNMPAPIIKDNTDYFEVIIPLKKVKS